MNSKEIKEALKIINEPITVNCIEYKYFDEENYNKITNVYENCLWFANNLEQINLTVENLQKENKQLKGSLQTHEILLKANVEENQKLRDKMDKAFQLLQILHYKFEDNDSIHNEIEDIQKILKE